MKNRTTVALESYLEHIAVIEKERGVVRASELAERMGCRRSSVTNALQRLFNHGLINYRSYRPITLTEKGKATIKVLSDYHKVLAEFFTKVLCFEEEFAQEEACRLEHRASVITIERISHYLDFLKHECPLSPEEQKKSFLDFLHKVKDPK